MILMDVHTHSVASGHGTSNTIADMAKAASLKGLKALGVTDHGPATLCAGTVSYFRSLKLAPKERFGIRIFYGIELDILDNTGKVDLDSLTLSGLDYAIASMHFKVKKPGSKEENTQSYIAAMKNPYVKIIGHCDDSKYPVDYEALVQAASEYHVLMEINNASLAPDGYRGNTVENNLELLKYGKIYKLPIVLSSDSHGAKHVGDVAYAEQLTHQVDYPEYLILNNYMDTFMQYTGVF